MPYELPQCAQRHKALECNRNLGKIGCLNKTMSVVHEVLCKCCKELYFMKQIFFFVLNGTKKTRAFWVFIKFPYNQKVRLSCSRMI